MHLFMFYKSLRLSFEKKNFFQKNQNQILNNSIFKIYFQLFKKFAEI